MTDPRQPPDRGALLDALRGAAPFYAAELRPPRTNAPSEQSIDDWIDTYHSVRRLTLNQRHVFITDNAVGQPEEENLRHLVINLGPDAPRDHITPFLTSKHPLAYCLGFAERAWTQGFRSLAVLGGDRHDGVPRCVEHAYQLRKEIRQHVPEMGLGGWLNPHGSPEQQVGFQVHPGYEADFYLTQVVSHHHERAVAAILEEADRRGVRLPGIFGVFYYRSARKGTLETLQRFFPVPIAGLQKEFLEEKLHPDAICARTIQRLQQLGVRRFYISNVPVSDAPARLEAIFKLVGSAE